ncbi:hypothetical protein FIBSPDRAFT_904809 [Athelia psychrophila]|uniref:Uncharacterized protein n=1 Tax=Athelia psychrophila TaxID=1759441 RepID=A0A167U9C5_9AGAM|nr:hypothetical protein FIBSPDRAFT_904809 [Fibularhizoctonia sp. CBS 109695]
MSESASEYEWPVNMMDTRTLDRSETWQTETEDHVEMVAYRAPSGAPIKHRSGSQSTCTFGAGDQTGRGLIGDANLIGATVAVLRGAKGLQDRRNENKLGTHDLQGKVPYRTKLPQELTPRPRSQDGRTNGAPGTLLTAPPLVLSDEKAY